MEVQSLSNMEQEFSDAGLRFINGSPFEREYLLLEYSELPKQVQTVDYFAIVGELYRDIQIFRGELAFVVMIAPILDPRDLVWFVGTVCDRAKALPEAEIERQVEELKPLMDSEKKGSNLGEISIQELITHHIKMNLDKQAAKGLRRRT